MKGLFKGRLGTPIIKFKFHQRDTPQFTTNLPVYKHISVIPCDVIVCSASFTIPLRIFQKILKASQCYIGIPCWGRHLIYEIWWQAYIIFLWYGLHGWNMVNYQKVLAFLSMYIFFLKYGGHAATLFVYFKFLGCPSRGSNSGLPYSSMTRYL